MNNLDSGELIDLLQSLGENERIEAKKASQSVGKSVLETICAFSNEPGMGGGYIVLGLAQKNSGLEPHYLVSGISDADRFQCEITTLCRQEFSEVIRPNFETISHSGKKLIVIYIPECESSKKPIFISSKGRERGTFRRVGPTDQVCTREDLDYLYQLRSYKKYDEMPLEEASFEDLSSTAINVYRQLRKEVNTTAPELEYSDLDLMRSLGVVVERRSKFHPTVAGVVLFGTESCLKRLFPMQTRIDYILVEGKEWVPDPEHRFHSIEICEALMTAIPRLQGIILSDLPQKFKLDEQKLQRIDNPSIPRNVIREALVNTLMHRDYTGGRPVQVRRYSNRVEFENAGHSLKSEDEIGLPGSIPRNPKIASILHDINMAEAKGTGIRAMREAMQHANLTLPLIESARQGNRFTLTLLSHHLFDQSDINWLAHFKKLNLSDEQALALIVLREMGAMTNSDYRMINGVDTLTASHHLRSLREADLIIQRGSGPRTYYVSSERLLTPDISKNARDIQKQVSASGDPRTPEALRNSLPQPVLQELNALGKKAPPHRFKEIIKKICSENYFTLEELAEILKRNSSYLRALHLRPMVESSELVLRFPQNPTHPKQAYKTAPSLKNDRTNSKLVE